ncbi:pyrophosphohydrolase domain-containing protein [Oceanobacillus kimchii]|uniref:Haloacid dehalogenase n=1 Tax=Oceanobacillus kimchii TaxID=746691 RepID=A0ABQ5THB6_9BACI|nr:HAD family hydrolase [Oceanobacillus kimchii]GLO66264.1 haloacid dehalogenase [Oceanobacillus kimchii]
MTKPYKSVREFHDAFNHTQANKPTVIDEKTALNRAVWTGEELVEFLYATSEGNEDKFNKLMEDFIIGLKDAATKTLSKKPDVSDKLVAQMDALVDVMYFNYGTFAIGGVEPQPLFDIVQDANMGKLWNDGKPRYRESDGKILKPPHWEEEYAPEPRLKKEIERQYKENLRSLVDQSESDTNNIIKRLSEETYYVNEVVVPELKTRIEESVKMIKG